MTSSYPSSPASTSMTQRVTIGAGTAVKIGFFGALGATLFSLVLSALAVVVILVLALLGVGVGALFQGLPR